MSKIPSDSIGRIYNVNQIGKLASIINVKLGKKSIGESTKGFKDNVFPNNIWIAKVNQF